MESSSHIQVPEDGVHIFYLASDDALRLKIVDRKVISNDGRHAPGERKWHVVLQEGLRLFAPDFIKGGFSNISANPVEQLV